MTRIAKKATQDGTYTVYREDEAVAWGLSSSAADALIAFLTAPVPMPSQEGHAQL